MIKFVQKFDFLPHALLGENGAGKSTMIKIITGVYKQDYGDLIIGSNKQSFSSPNEANKSGISVVHQERNLIRRFSVPYLIKF